MHSKPNASFHLACWCLEKIGVIGYMKLSQPLQVAELLIVGLITVVLSLDFWAKLLVVLLTVQHTTKRIWK